MALASGDEYHRLLVVSDLELPERVKRSRSAARRKMVGAVTSAVRRASLAALGVPAVVIPAFHLARAERVKLALVEAAANRLVAPGALVLALAGVSPLGPIDSLTLLRVGAHGGEEVALGCSLGRLAGEPEVVEALLELALSVGAEGWEGRPIGALFTLGAAPRVMAASRQLSLNPFLGYPERERNLLDPAVREAVRPFMTLDGAMVVRDDGVVLAAGRYLVFEDRIVDVPLGLGARHMAAAGVSAETGATAIAVSQTTGTVRVFHDGAVALELNPTRRRM